jgi:uncharacterized protein
MREDITGAQAHANDKIAQAKDPPHSESGSTENELTPDAPPKPPEEGERQSKRPRGFAAMDRAIVSEIARKGGKAAHSAGTAHEFTSDEARAAGQKGGRATHAKRRQATPTPAGTPSQRK